MEHCLVLEAHAVQIEASAILVELAGWCNRVRISDVSLPARAPKPHTVPHGTETGPQFAAEGRDWNWKSRPIGRDWMGLEL